VCAAKNNDESGEWLPVEEDSRESERKPLSTVLVTNPVPAQVTDISARGMGLESRQAIRVSIENLFTLASGTTRAQVLGQVKWCKLAGTRPMSNGEIAPLYRCGIEFRDDVSSFLSRNGPQIDSRI